MTAALAPEEWVALQRAAFLLVPCICAALLVIVQKPTPREAVGALVAFLWQLPALLLLHILATWQGWWSFGGERNMLIGLPIDLWIGWAIWWGPVAVLVNRWIGVPVILAASVAIDLLTMTRLAPLVAVGPNWLIGDAVAIGLCLAPGLWIAQLTRDDRLPKRRAMFHVLGWGGFMALVIPVCTLTYLGAPLEVLYRLPTTILDWLVVAVAAMLLMIGIAATAEFARVGDGTPIPFDPPKRVVSSGPYAFMANPMQIISAFFMAMLAAYAGSWGLAFVAAMFVIFDTIFATWFNRANIARAMPAEWQNYRGEVNEWRVRWRPFVRGEAEIVISPDGISRAVWDRVWPVLEKCLDGRFRIVSAERSLFQRLTYRCDGHEDTGIRALARILEHGNAMMALFAWALRFPYLSGALQRISWVGILLWRRRHPAQTP